MHDMATTPPSDRPDASERRRELAEPIPDSFENVVGAVLRTPAKKDWRYQKNQ